jgi:hypothetical protein
MKKETLKEAAKNYSEGWGKNDDIKSFIAGAEWQAERMYSEEEVKHIISEALQSALVTVDLEQWFNQFKQEKNEQ